MTARLEAITLTNFRSVRGTISLPLEAPVVLIHGPNGAGKTSVLCAIELALTGNIPELKRADPEYAKYLVHRGAARAVVEISRRGENDDHLVGENQIAEGKFETSGLLKARTARFFSERCYLAQATLGRLLEIYQNTDSRSSESALTRFVRELLGIDQLDALVEGLHAAGDVRRLRRLVPAYRDAEAERDSQEKQRLRANSELASLETETAACRERLGERLVQLLPARATAPALDDNDAIEYLFANEQDDQRQLLLGRFLRQIEALRAEWRAASSAEVEDPRRAIEEQAETTHAQLRAWRSETGKA